jgi:hypothetical protein
LNLSYCIFKYLISAAKYKYPKAYMQTSEHTTAGLSGMKPENPLSISPLEPRNTKLMVARAFKEPHLSKEVTDSAKTNLKSTNASNMS